MSLPNLRIPFTHDIVPLSLPGASAVGEFSQLPWLVFFALFPLYEIAKRSGALASFGWGYLAGVTWLLLHWDWLLSFGWLPVILLSLYFALPVGLFTLILHWLLRTDRPGYVLWGGAFCWVGIEYLRSFGFWAFPWNLLGYSQARVPQMIQVADLGGVYLVSLVIVLANGAIYLLLGSVGRRRPRWGHAFLGAAVLLATLGYGEWRLLEPLQEQPAERLKLALVQGNRDTSETWSDNVYVDALEAYCPPSQKVSREWMNELNDWHNKHYELSGPFIEPAMLVVWPEVAIPRSMSPRRAERIPHQVKSTFLGRENLALLSGVMGRPVSDEELINGMMLQESEQAPIWTHSKVRLVPYGETVPLSGIAKFLDYPWPGGDLISGRELAPFNWRGISFAGGICFDNVFSFVYREQVRQGAQVLLLVTNNSWYDLHSGIRQHGDMDILRAVEFRRPMARVSTTGWSQLVNAHGVVLPENETRINQADVVTAWVEPGEGATPYLVIGDLFAQVCLLLGILLVARVLLIGRSEGLL